LNSKRPAVEPDHVPASDIADQIKHQLGEKWLSLIYVQRVLPLRTRQYKFEKAQSSARVTIQHTLLGIELKIGRQRLLCPDLATARYLSVFARIGCSEVAIPYDITKISHLADELESSWYRMLLLVEKFSHDQTDRFAARLRNMLFANIRAEIAAAGADQAVRELKESTK
jgi:hypothetical protein